MNINGWCLGTWYHRTIQVSIPLSIIYFNSIGYIDIIGIWWDNSWGSRASQFWFAELGGFLESFGHFFWTRKKKLWKWEPKGFLGPIQLGLVICSRDILVERCGWETTMVFFNSWDCAPSISSSTCPQLCVMTAIEVQFSKCQPSLD